MHVSIHACIYTYDGHCTHEKKKREKEQGKEKEKKYIWRSQYYNHLYGQRHFFHFFSLHIVLAL